MIASEIFIDADATDAILLKQIRSALRGTAPILIGGDLSARMDDAGPYRAWVASLAAARVPLFLVARGTIGARGLALSLLADRVFATAEVRSAPNWLETPGLAALACHGFGPVWTRNLLFGGCEPTDLLAEIGHLRRSDDPDADLEASMSRCSASLKSALVAARLLPFEEALEFGLWLAPDKSEAMA